MGLFGKPNAAKLIEASDLHFFEASRVALDFLKMIENQKRLLTVHDVWLLRSFQLSVILRCLRSQPDFAKSYARDFDTLFDHAMNPCLSDHPDVASAMNFFAKQEDVIRCSGFIIDSIGLDLIDPMPFIAQYWEEGHLVPALHKMPYAFKLLQCLYVSAGSVIKVAYGLGSYQQRLGNLFSNDEINDLNSKMASVPNNSAEIFSAMKEVYAQE